MRRSERTRLTDPVRAIGLTVNAGDERGHRFTNGEPHRR
jgi:hypothetical protein